MARDEMEYDVSELMDRVADTQEDYSWAKYARAVTGGEVHILNDGESYCGKTSFTEGFRSLGAVKGRYSMCQECLSAKHATDQGKDELDIATSG